MLRSMTAYGRGSITTELGSFVVELSSVNRKFLDIQFSLPPDLTRFECDLKNWTMLSVERGQIVIKVNISFKREALSVLRPNLPLARQLKTAWRKIADELDLKEEPFHLSLLQGNESLFLYEENLLEEENCRQTLKKAFDLALKEFLKVKVQEGAALEADIVNRLALCRDSLEMIKENAPDATKKYREKLMDRLQDLLPDHVENEERILREVALFAEKIDITEEITRFYCHLDHFKESLQQETSLSVGKKLEFIIQELNREANTIGSKSLNAEIARRIIQIKSELEKIREQIQNIE